MRAVELFAGAGGLGLGVSLGLGVAAGCAGRDRERPAAVGLVVDELRVLAEDVVAAGPRGVLELEDGVRVEQVVLAFAAPLVLAADLELAVGALGRAIGERQRVAGRDVGGDLVETDAADVGAALA